MKNYDFVFALRILSFSFMAKLLDVHLLKDIFRGGEKSPPTIEHINQPEFALKTLCFAGQQKFRVRCHLRFYAVCHFLSLPRRESSLVRGGMFFQVGNLSLRSYTKTNLESSGRRKICLLLSLTQFPPLMSSSRSHARTTRVE
jgi:hypothetical protein